MSTISRSPSAAGPPYPVRTAAIGGVYMISASSSAFVQFGDRGVTNAFIRAIAVQRAEDHWTAGHAYFESYDIFWRPRPSPAAIAPDGGEASMESIHLDPYIRVGCIRIIAAGNSSSVQAGNGKAVIAESRIKHIRQYPQRSSPPSPPA